MDRSRILRWAWAVGPVLLYMGLIFFLSGQSRLPRYRMPDKLAHTAEYAVLGGLVCRSLVVLGRAPAVRTVLLAIAISVAFGVTDEVHQMFVPRRDASLLDLLADAVGSTLGAATFAALAAWLRRREPA